MVENTTLDHDEYIDFPSWETTETNIKLMDAHNRTYVGLYKTEEPNADEFLLVGGGEKGEMSDSLNWQKQ